MASTAHCLSPLPPASCFQGAPPSLCSSSAGPPAAVGPPEVSPASASCINPWGLSAFVIPAPTGPSSPQILLLLWGLVGFSHFLPEAFRTTTHHRNLLPRKVEGPFLLPGQGEAEIHSVFMDQTIAFLKYLFPLVSGCLRRCLSQGTASDTQA